METGEGGGEKPVDAGGEKRDIRRPMNAFLIFCKRHRSMVREKHPDRDNRSVTRILGDLWANLADDEKSVYTNLAKQYKDAFMKANPDYKWHSTDRLPQPAKMATRPSNVRPPRSLSTSDSSMLAQAEGDKLAGLNLLLMAGQQSMPARDKQSVMSHVLERRLTSPDLMGANSALLQLAEMCSTELTSRQTESSLTHGTPPKKRARHWSHSDVERSDVSERHKIPSTSLLFHTIPNPSLSLPPVKSQPPSATQTSQSEDSVPKLEPLPEQPESERPPVIVVRQRQPGEFSSLSKMENPPTVKPPPPPTPKTAQLTAKPPPPTLSGQTGYDGYVCQPHAKPVNTDLGIPPKKNFTKLQDLYRAERQPPATSAGGGCLSDQNDNAIFTCGKLVVDHIIDRLFSASFTASEQPDTSTNPSRTDIEKVRKIITADMTERETTQGPSSKDMGKLLSEVVHKPQNLVEKVIEEAYSLDLKRITKIEPARRTEPVPNRLPCPAAVEKKPEPNPGLGHTPQTGSTVAMVETWIKTEPSAEPSWADATRVVGIAEETPAKVKVTQADIDVKLEDNVDKEPSVNEAPLVAPPGGVFQLQVPVKEEAEDRYSDDMTLDPTKDDGGGDYMHDEEDGFSQPVRKSRRRNRGQRYQELINEGIIQPSKERLAARRHELVPALVSNSIFGLDDPREEDMTALERSLYSLKRSMSESDPNFPDEKRYRTGDFDLEAEIATLPPCSLDQVSRRRGARKRSDSESSRKPYPPSPGHEGAGPRSPVTTVAPPPTGPLTGSQKRKARKHSINRLVASSDSNSNTKPPGIETSIPMVRDATVSRVLPPSTTSDTLPSTASASPPSTTDTAQPVSTPASDLHPAVTSAETRSAQCAGDESSQTRDSDGHILANAIERTLTAGLSRDTAGLSRDSAERNSIVEKSTLPEQDEERTDSKETAAEKTDTEVLSAGSPVGLLSYVAEKKSSLLDSLSEFKLKQESVTASSLPSMLHSGLSGRGDDPADEGNKLSTALTQGDDAETGTDDDSSSTGVVFNFLDGQHTAVKKTHRDTDAHCVDSSFNTDSSVTYTRIMSVQGPSKLNAKSASTETDFHGKTGAFDKPPVNIQQLKDHLSRDSALGSSTENPEDSEKDCSVEDFDKPQVFLSETSGLLCIGKETRGEFPQGKAQSVSVLLQAEQSNDRSTEALWDCSSVRPLISSASLAAVAVLPQEDDPSVDVRDPMLGMVSRSPVAMEMADSPDSSYDGGNKMVVSVSAAGCFGNVDEDVSPYSSGEESPGNGPRVTTVAMATTDAMPTALSLEMMEEDGMVEAGVGNPMLCGSPMPGSPSITVVHS